MLKSIARMPLKKRRTVAFLTALATIILFVLPFSVYGPSDKVLHAAFFGTLALLGYHLATSERAYLLTVLGVVVLGAVVELVQSQVPGRQMSALDLLANLIGIASAVALIYVLKGRKSNAGE